MQMGRARQPGVVREAHHALHSLLLVEHGARRHAIVPDEGGRFEVGVNLLRELLDLHLVILDLFAGYRIVNRPGRPDTLLIGLLGRGKGILDPALYHFSSLIGGIGSGNSYNQ